jgi:hypothetical protein
MTRAESIPLALLAVAGAFLWASRGKGTLSPSAPVLAPLEPLAEGVYTVTEYVKSSLSGKSRGVRNNNPGNLRRTRDKWDGLAAQQNDPAFFQFVAPEFGLRALAILLRNYGRQGYRTIATVISRYAPSSENNTAAYVAAVRNATGIPATQLLDLNSRDTVRGLMLAIVKHENGSQPYDAGMIERALDLAGF